jgi:hypothetical protein
VALRASEYELLHTDELSLFRWDLISIFCHLEFCSAPSVACRQPLFFVPLSLSKKKNKNNPKASLLQTNTPAKKPADKQSTKQAKNKQSNKQTNANKKLTRQPSKHSNKHKQKPTNKSHTLKHTNKPTKHSNAQKSNQTKPNQKKTKLKLTNTTKQTAFFFARSLQLREPVGFHA